MYEQVIEDDCTIKRSKKWTLRVENVPLTDGREKQTDRGTLKNGIRKLKRNEVKRSGLKRSIDGLKWSSMDVLLIGKNCMRAI